MRTESQANHPSLLSTNSLINENIETQNLKKSSFTKGKKT